MISNIYVFDRDKFDKDCEAQDKWVKNRFYRGLHLPENFTEKELSELKRFMEPEILDFEDIRPKGGGGYC